MLSPSLVRTLCQGYGADKGIIPLVCERIFERISAERAAAAGGGDGGATTTFRVEASMLEIYMERVKDLMAPNPNAGELRVRNSPTKGFYVDGLSRCAVADAASILTLMDQGAKARTVASTAMNATSSRAHTIFQVSESNSEAPTWSTRDRTLLGCAYVL